MLFTPALKNRNTNKYLIPLLHGRSPWCSQQISGLIVHNTISGRKSSHKGFSPIKDTQLKIEDFDDIISYNSL